MKHVRSILAGIVWTAVLLVLYRIPIGAQGADWRLPLFLVISWVLGLVLIAWVVFGRQVDPTKGILITVDENTGLANRRAFQGHVEPLLVGIADAHPRGVVTVSHQDPPSWLELPVEWLDALTHRLISTVRDHQ